MPNSTGAAPEAPRTGEPKESLAPAVAGESEKDDSCGCNSNFECNICLTWLKSPWLHLAATSSAGHACTGGSMHSHPSVNALSARVWC